MISPSAKKAFVCLLAVVLAPEPAARAQFFFPFFDNRPPPPPAIPQRREFRPKPKKPHAHPAIPERQRHPAVAKAEPEKPAAPQPESPPPPYEPQLLRLSEIMGALAVLESICGFAAPDKPKSQDSQTPESAWRESMQKLMESQDAGPLQRERLAGAYNRGLRGYEYFHRQCTASADLARRRFLDEGGRLAHDIATQYREK
jgi:uncharacterized protein (TIGR02301 family)